MSEQTNNEEQEGQSQGGFPINRIIDDYVERCRKVEEEERRRIERSYSSPRGKSDWMIENGY